MAGNGNFPRKSWEYCTAYSNGGGGSEGLSLKIRPYVEDLFLAYLLRVEQAWC